MRANKLTSSNRAVFEQNNLYRKKTAYTQEKSFHALHHIPDLASISGIAMPHARNILDLIWALIPLMAGCIFWMLNSWAVLATESLTFQNLENSPYKSVVEAAYSVEIEEMKSSSDFGENGGIWVARANLNGDETPELIVRFHVLYNCGTLGCWNTVLSFENGAWKEHTGVYAQPDCPIELTSRRHADGWLALRICDGFL